MGAREEQRNSSLAPCSYRKDSGGGTAEGKSPLQKDKTWRQEDTEEDGDRERNCCWRR